MSPFLRAAIFCSDAERPTGRWRFTVVDAVAFDAGVERIDVYVALDRVGGAKRQLAIFFEEASDRRIGSGPPLAKPHSWVIAPPPQIDTWADVVKVTLPDRAGSFRLVIAVDAEVIGCAPLLILPSPPTETRS